MTHQFSDLKNNFPHVICRLIELVCLSKMGKHRKHWLVCNANKRVWIHIYIPSCLMIYTFLNDNQSQTRIPKQDNKKYVFIYHMCCKIIFIFNAVLLFDTKYPYFGRERHKIYLIATHNWHASIACIQHLCNDLLAWLCTNLPGWLIKQLKILISVWRLQTQPVLVKSEKKRRQMRACYVDSPLCKL